MMPPRMPLLGLTLLLASVSLWPGRSRAAGAIDVGPLLDQTKAAVGQGNYARAIEALQTALEQVRQAAPLTAQPFVLVGEPAKYYGGYVPRRDNVFRRDEEMHFYLEPKNLVYPRTDQGLYNPAFSVDFQILDAAGVVVAKRERFGSFQFSSKSPLQDIYVNLHLEFTGAPAGSYQVRFVLHDTKSPKTATVTQAIILK